MPSRRGVECWPPGRADRRDVTMSEPELSTPTTIGAIRVANRIAMAPLTRARAGMDGVQSPLAIEYYRQRASAGLIISEATNISRQGRGYAFTAGIYTDAQVEAWKPVAQAVRDAGGRIVLQLWHVGRVSHTSLQANGAAPVGPPPSARGSKRILRAASPRHRCRDGNRPNQAVGDLY
jgi:N-ethylmaleimide reductase